MPIVTHKPITPSVAMPSVVLLIVVAPELIATNKHSGLLGSFVSYEANRVLWMRPPDYTIAH